ncbi:MAG: hypothetical protein ABIN48_10835 [Ginsengibacter sp.]
MFQFFIFLALSFSPPTEYTATLSQVRNLYIEANKSEKTCKELISLLEPFDATNNPLYYGYKAGATMIMAKHSVNPISKLSWFNKGKKMLETAIQADNKDVELRCLRFGIQSNIPSFLSYKQHLSLDKKFIIKSYPQVKDEVLRKNIVTFLTKWGQLSSEEKQLLK